MRPAAIEADDGIDLDPHGVVELDADAREDVDQLRVRAHPGAAAGEVLGIALEHHRVPAGVAQELGRQEPAERAADHQGTSLRHQLNDAALRAHAIVHAMVSWPGR